MLAARRASESASRAAIDGLGVFADRRPEHLDRRPGSVCATACARSGASSATIVSCSSPSAPTSSGTGCCSLGSWPRTTCCCTRSTEAPVTLADCEELAAELGEPDGWSVAARFAAEILPGIFRLDDPCVRLRLAPEGRYALEQILDGLPAEIFAADDALGWVYQFWQKDKKDEVNASERKIGGADLGPVTQLFTENYMVRFLLENSLGAWWAARHPDSPLVKGFEYLRFDDDGRAGCRIVRRLARPRRRGHGHGPVLRIGALPRRGVLDAVADARRGGGPRARGRAGRGAARQPVRPRARPPVRADRDVRRRAAGVEGRRRLAPATRPRTSPAPESPSKRPSRNGRHSPAATGASRTRSSDSTTCSATPTRSAA